RSRVTTSTRAVRQVVVARLTNARRLFYDCRSPTSEVRPMAWVGRSLPRREDPELLRGVARYVGDLVRPGMLHAAFLRSPFPHALIREIDTSAALAVEGVAAVLTGADLPADLPPQPCNHLYHGQRETPYFALARERARYVGEPVAVVVAE